MQISREEYAAKRYELAKEVMCVMLSNSGLKPLPPSEQVKYAIGMADGMLIGLYGQQEIRKLFNEPPTTPES